MMADEEKSTVDVFIEWAKHRLDDVAVHAKILEMHIDKLSGEVRRETEEAIASAKVLIGAGEDRLEEVTTKGEEAIRDAYEWFQDILSEFQKDCASAEERARKRD